MLMFQHATKARLATQRIVASCQRLDVSDRLTGDNAMTGHVKCKCRVNACLTHLREIMTLH